MLVQTRFIDPANLRMLNAVDENQQDVSRRRRRSGLSVPSALLATADEVIE
jgi:hypothetical protein